MQSDVVTIAVSTGIGVSVVAGILSGVCYVLAHGFTRKRVRDSRLEWHCVVCGSYLRNPIEKIKIVICAQCDERVCKKRCSKRDYARRDWICYTCLKQPSFLENILNSLRLPFKNNYLKESDEMGKKLRNVELSLKKERECVRDFIEKLVSSIVGDSVDDASILKMYNDKNYEVFFSRYHHDLSDAITKLSSSLQISMKNSSLAEENPSSAHTNLKQLIEKILNEASRLPQIRKILNRPQPTEERTYEELLATAILNKIIDKKENLASSPEASTSDDKTNKIFSVADDTSDLNWKEVESSSTSSLDDYLYSDSSHVSSKYVDRVSLTIQQRIDEVPSTSDPDDIDGDFSYLDDSRSSILDDSNWYLQKRQFNGTSSPVPVPMLVPNPNTAAKVLIGDQEIDDTSDLSDANSDNDDPDIENLIIDTSIILEEKDPKSYLSDEETSFDSGVREDRDDFNDKDKDEDSGNLINFDENVDDVSLLSNIERDTEYLEKYSSLPRTVYKEPPEREDLLPTNFEENSNLAEELIPELPTSPPPKLSEIERPVFEGSYSKREKEKWNHPIDLAYNPYSEENIRKRIETKDRFGRDYYTKQASLPSGATKLDEDGFVWPSENDSLYRAEPVAITDSEENPDSFHTDITSDTNSDFSLIQSYNIEDGKIYNEPYSSSENLQIRTNEKEVFLPESEELIEPEIVDYQSNLIDRIHYEIKVNKKEAYPPENDTVKPEKLPRQVKVKVNEKEPVAPKPENDELTSKLEIRLNEKEAFEPEVEQLIKHEPIAEARNGSVDLKPKRLEKQSRIEESPESEPKMEPKPQVDGFKTPVEDKPSFTFRRLASQTSEELKDQNRTPPSPNIVSKRSDNTWIKKIYSNPIVRNFALTNREQIPSVLEEITKPKDKSITLPLSPEDNAKERKIYSSITPQNSLEIKDSNNNEDHSLNHNFSLEFSDTSSIASIKNEPEVTEIKEKRLVANRLGEFSKSFPNLTKTEVPSDKEIEVNEKLKPRRETRPVSYIYENSISVKNLRKLFEQNEDQNYKKDKPVHSLTARSISKEMKLKLASYGSSRDGSVSQEDNVSHV